MWGTTERLPKVDQSSFGLNLMAESASDDFFANLIADVRFSDAQMSKKQKKNKNKKSQKMKGNGWTSKPLSPPTASPAAPSDSTLKKKQKKGPSGPNLLRNAIKNSSGGATGTAAERKANEVRVGRGATATAKTLYRLPTKLSWNEATI